MKSAISAQPDAILAISSRSPLPLACFCMPAGPMKGTYKGADLRGSTDHQKRPDAPGKPPGLVPPGPEKKAKLVPSPPPKKWPGVTPGGTRPAGSSTDKCSLRPKQGLIPPPPQPKRPCPVNEEFSNSPQTPLYNVSLDYSSDDNCSSAGSSYTSAGERKETDTLKSLRLRVEHRQAKCKNTSSQTVRSHFWLFKL